jgi:hypothetical protein
MKAITEQEYIEHSDNYTGFCTDCQSFTTSCVEPDAEGYTCEECEKNTVCGTEQALIMGLVDIS